jgi:hypothetical protein
MQTGTIGIPNDAGLVIDSNSADKYETTLHRDTRFWDAVAARKSKGKKRRQRKFLSNNQEQFSISDDARDDISGEGYPTASSNKRSSGSFVSDGSAMGMNSNPKGDLSDSELQVLIMQLAHAEENPIGREGNGRVSSNDTTPSNNTTANVELQALDDLEKELGLELFKDEGSTATALDSTTVAAEKSPMEANNFSTSQDMKSETPSSSTNVGGIDDLDELERYLQTLDSK